MKYHILLCLLISASLQAGEVTLMWDPSPTEGVTGYKLYRAPFPLEGKTPEEAALLPDVKVTDAGNVLIFKLTNLADGQHYFAATAYSTEGESEFSNVVTTTIAPVAFKITSLSASMRWFGVVLLATTSTPASAMLRYTDIATGEHQTVIASPEANKTAHRAVLYLPMGNQKYYRYEWTVTDATGSICVEGGTFQVR